MQSQRNGCGFLMLVKLRQLECVQGFVHLMDNLLEVLGKVMEFILPSGRAVCGNSQELLPVRILNPLIQMRPYRRRWTLWDLSSIEQPRHLNPARHPSPSSQYSE
jgi:hypothetical protein